MVLKSRVAKVFVHAGPIWPEGKGYLINADLEAKFRTNPEQYRREAYGYIRRELSIRACRSSATVKAIVRHPNLEYQESFFKTSGEAKKWLRQQVNKGLRDREQNQISGSTGCSNRESEAS